MSTSNFVHLNLHTEYSLQNGVNSIDSFLDKAEKLGMKALAITDYANMFGAIEFYQRARKKNIKPIIGIEVSLYYSEQGEIYTLTLLAKNFNGYRNLVKISSEIYKNSSNGNLKVNIDILKKYNQDIIALSSSLSGEISQAILKKLPDETLIKIIENYQNIYGNESFFLEVQSNEHEEQKIVNEKLFDIASNNNINLVATNNVYYIEKNGYELQDIIICIQSGVKVKDRNRKRFFSKEQYFKSEEDMKNSFDDKFLIAIKNTVMIAELCNLEIEFGHLQFPYYIVPNEYKNMDDFLSKLCHSNLKNIYKENLTKEIEERLEYELSVIFKMGYSGYFIVVWDFIKYAKETGIPIGPGRGSAAGSLVAYCLGITMIDPIKYNLLFERFLNPERISMPDIDIDICRERRGELIEYVTNKYGRNRVAHIITFGRMKAKAAIRDVGRVLDVDLKKIDKLAKLLPANQALEKSLKEEVEVAKLYTTDIELQKVIDISIKIENKVRHTSTHAAGILITKENLDETVPIYLDEKEGVTATQFQMKELEDLGLLKIDFLGLKNLTNIQRTVDYIKKYKDKNFNLYNVPIDDKKVYDMLSLGDTTGVFQLESNGLRAIIQRLKPNKFEDIVALLSLYRPGPLQSGMVDDFIDRKNGIEIIEYPHKNLEFILKETYGVILYQEQVMKIASFMANYSLGEADLLRRAMGKKNFEIMHENRNKFVLRSIENGYSKEKAEEIFDLIDKFAGYGFNKSHSVSYAMISYWTAYFKVHYPHYYYAALLTSEISETGNIAYYFNDAKEHKVRIFPPNVNRPSVYFDTADDGITFSLAAIKNLGINIVKRIVEDFEKNGKYTTLDEFVRRNKKNSVNKKSLEALILSGALDELKGNRKEKFLSIDKVIEYTQKNLVAFDEIQQMNLFGAAHKTIDSFSLSSSEDFSLDDKLKNEKEFLGFYISSHPLDKYKNLVNLYSLDTTNKCKEISNGKIKTFGIISNLKKSITKNKENMAFFDLDCYDVPINCIAFPKVYENYLSEFIEKNVVLILGNIQIDNYKGRETKKIIVNKIISLKDIFNLNEQTLYIMLRSPNIQDKISILNDLLKQNKGKTKVVIFQNNKNNKYISNERINLSKQFLYDLIHHVGIENVKISIKE